MNENPKFPQALAIVSSIFLITGLIEVTIINSKFGEVLITKISTIISFLVKTYIIYLAGAVFFLLLSTFTLRFLRKISPFKKAEKFISIITITSSLIIFSIIFLYIYNNIVSTVFSKKGAVALFLMFLSWIILCLILEYLFIGLFKVQCIRRLFSYLGTLRFHVLIIVAYVATGCLMAVSVAPNKPLSNIKRPNIWLISIDTLRQDRLSCYGYKNNKTPNIDRLASESVLFENAFSPDSWTLPAHASMFTSLSPEVHGADGKDKKISPTLITLAEILSKHGYNCIGTVDTEPMGFVGAKRNFDQGFKYYSHYPIVMSPHEHLLFSRLFNQFRLPFQKEHSSSMISSILRWLPKKSASPYFFFLHLYDVHVDHNLISHFWGYPYYPFAPYSKILIKERESLRNSSLIGKGNAIYLNEINLKSAQDSTYDGPPSEQIRFFSSLYDCGVSLVDAQLGKLFNQMKLVGVYDNSIIILTSDHGEAFYEHRRMGHTNHYDECLRVPLLVKSIGPNSIMKRVSMPVSLLDVAPTLLELANLPSFREAEGKSLTKVIFDDDTKNQESYYTTRTFISGSLNKSFFSLRYRDYKILNTPVNNKGIIHFKTELYNIRIDKKESDDLSKFNVQLFSEYFDIVNTYSEYMEDLRYAVLGNVTDESIEVTDRLKERLKALGYIN